LAATLLISVLVAAPAAQAAGGFGFRASSVEWDDEQTEMLFQLDSDPIFDIYYRGQFDRQALLVGLGYGSWEHAEGGLATELEYVPIFVSWRYHFAATAPVSPYIGIGACYQVYDATVEASFFMQEETGSMLSVDPVLGIELFAPSPIRLFVEATYAFQVVDSDDLDWEDSFYEPLAVDMSGLRASAGIAFVFGD
jgi:hypothetical protein